MHNIKIDYLRNHPQFIQTCAEWSFQTWGHRTPNRTLADFIESRKAYLNDTKLPLTLIALVNGQAIGMCSLKEYEGIQPTLLPWLSSLFVSEPFRNRGVGTLLEKRICQRAVELGYTEIYCFTSDKSVIPWYEKHHWEVWGTDYVHDHVEVTILKKIIVRDSI